MSEMGDGSTPESAHLSHDEIAKLWSRFRAGEVIRCPRDTSGMALAVDGAAKTYRIVCTQCGLASPWFGTTASGIVFRNPPTTMSPSGRNLHDE